ncbi:helix-turn-helix transcriptional regulator [Lactobacillus sp. 3B(2020)]|uniref:helix-turn-helix transcriptional regulator n=1 Tax=Lactobacillus sp. 3B(2020) TaxID=2695882 RepID=UPI0015DE624F|nr:helix-turn-helix transcriptional regulator [Lactobacillus sp. 3B(2020)]QLL69831.1 helix-turn-helix domain-containing protein [Lactobacillus sp. 3B(2020)]
MAFTLKAARVNAGLTQAQAAEKLTDYFGMAISRQRVMKYEANPEETPIGFAKGFADIYGLSVSDIVFSRP